MIAHFDAGEGASGDLIFASLIDAGAPLEAVREALATLPVKLPSLDAPEVRVRGFRVRRLEVGDVSDDVVRGLPDVVAILEGGALPARALDRARRVFGRLAEAEARCHGVPVEKIHFHEVGALDAILDVAGVAVALELLGVDDITFSPLGVGTGAIDTAHGRIPVPVPAVVELTQGVPIRRTGLPTEILTPTGAALLTTLGRPSAGETVSADRTGVSAGHREFPGGPSLLRVSIGEAAERSAGLETWGADRIEVLETNLDDLNPELLPGVLESVLAAGALDVTLTPVLMKKGRPGHVLTALAPPALAPVVAAAIFRETSTLGIRRETHSRWILPREIREVESRWGPVRVKVADLGNGHHRAAPEHDSLREVADREGIPLRDVYEAVGELIRSHGWTRAGEPVE